jgi:BirA family biotin operon repressor/biotin-[acetyl-CoA-carboxylase] ligase
VYSSIKYSYIHIDSIDSTNEYIKQLILNKEIEEGVVVSTKYQKKGRGEGVNIWESNYGDNLLFSIHLCPSFVEPQYMFMLSKVISLGVVDFLNTLGKKFTIKWPNDIYFEDKKIAGILIENSLKGSCVDYSIVGIGININQKIFADNLPNPISLVNIFDNEFDLADTQKQIIEYIDLWYHKLMNKNYEEIDKLYLLNLFRYEKYHSFKVNNTLFSAKIIDVKQNGELILKNRQENQLSFYFKEIEFVL